MSNEVQLSFSQGDDVTYNFTVAGPNEEVIDITGATVESQIRRDYGKSLVASFTPIYTDPINGKFTLTLDNATTEAITVSGKQERFVFDVEVTYPSGDKQKIVYGSIVIVREVTI